MDVAGTKPSFPLSVLLDVGSSSL